jgi:PT repeat
MPLPLHLYSLLIKVSTVPRHCIMIDIWSSHLLAIPSFPLHHAEQPSTMPSCQPTSQPTGQPTSHPSAQPTGQPTSQPTQVPTTFYRLQINIGIFQVNALRLISSSLIAIALAQRSPLSLSNAQPTLLCSASPQQRLVGISYFNFVNNPNIALLFRQAVSSSVAIPGLTLENFQIVYFYGQVLHTTLLPLSSPRSSPLLHPSPAILHHLKLPLYKAELWFDMPCSARTSDLLQMKQTAPFILTTLQFYSSSTSKPLYPH